MDPCGRRHGELPQSPAETVEFGDGRVRRLLVERDHLASVGPRAECRSAGTGEDQRPDIVVTGKPLDLVGETATVSVSGRFRAQRLTIQSSAMEPRSCSPMSM